MGIIRGSLLVFLALTVWANSYAQSFEGVLTYKVEFQITEMDFGGMTITKEQILEKMKSEGEFFEQMRITIKEGNYLKEVDSDLNQKIIYLSSENKTYTLDDSSEYVAIGNASKVMFMDLDVGKPTIELRENADTINGIVCSALIYTWGTGKEEYYFNSSTATIDPKLFASHKYEYLNEILQTTKSYPLKIVKSVSDFIKVTMTVTDILEESVDEHVFDLPEFTNPEKDVAEFMKAITGCDVMKIKVQ